MRVYRKVCFPFDCDHNNNGVILRKEANSMPFKPPNSFPKSTHLYALSTCHFHGCSSPTMFVPHQGLDLVREAHIESPPGNTVNIIHDHPIWGQSGDWTDFLKKLDWICTHHQCACFLKTRLPNTRLGQSEWSMNFQNAK